MSATYHSVVVTFDNDLSESMTEAVCDAIRCLQHVVSVDPQEADVDFFVAKTRAKALIRSRMFAALEEI